MIVFSLLLLLLSTFCVSSRSRAEDVRSEDDIFEDALLEHLNVLGEEQEDYGSNIYDSDDDDSQQVSELLHMLDIIKKEAHKELESVERNSDEHTVFRSDKKKDSDESIQNTPEKNYNIKINIKRSSQENKKKESNDHIRIRDVASKKRKVESTNSQEAMVVPDDSIDKQNEIDKAIDLRSVLDPPVTNAPANTTTPSKPPHIKQRITSSKGNKMGLDRVSFIAVIAGCSVASIAGIALAAYCWYKLRSANDKDEVEEQKVQNKKSSVKKKKSEQKEKRPLSEDEKMVENAEMYHYQHVKSQMQQLGQLGANSENFHNGDTSEEEDEDTVYECPGLAAPGDMKVVNPLFSDGDSSHHSDKQSETASYAGTPTPPNEQVDTATAKNN